MCSSRANPLVGRSLANGLDDGPQCPCCRHTERGLAAQAVIILVAAIFAVEAILAVAATADNGLHAIDLRIERNEVAIVQAARRDRVGE
jgi:hypothetical protein